MSISKNRKKLINKSIKDSNLQTALNRSTTAYRVARDAIMAEFDLASAQTEVREIKERCIFKMDELFLKFKESAEKINAVVHEAKDADEAAQIVHEIAQANQVKQIVKSKSMLTEEIELNSHLSKYGYQITETDLGEFIIQLANEKPSHFTQPAMHKTREDIAKLFEKEITHAPVDSDITNLAQIARRELRQKFIDADMGISGANIAIADTGSIVIIANEGNDRLVTTLPLIHVAIVGYEKLVENMDDAVGILKVLSKSGTGQKMTAYVNFITGPSRSSDIEKTLTLGVHGPREVHIIFVDNGRKQIAKDIELIESLYCIKCGACLTMCPVFKSVGGHAYGNTYMGGIGAVLTAHLDSLDASEDTVNMCAGCNLCKSVCPASIDVPEMVLTLRNRLANKHGIPTAGKTAMAALKRPNLFQKMLKMARSLQSPAVGSDGLLKNIPFANSFFGERKFPAVASEFFRDWVKTNYQTPANSQQLTVNFYAGCVIDFVYPEIGKSIWQVLAKSGVDTKFPQNQCCCGAPALYMGDKKSASKLAIDNILALESNAPDYIITGCPTCAVVLRDEYLELLKGTPWESRAQKISAKVIDFSAFVTDVLKLEIKPEMQGKVTYHDPCHQVRGLKTSACPRNILKQGGLDLVEMKYSDECCGFAGSYAIKQNEISNSMLKRKIENIENTQAEIIATDCPGCIMQIRGGLAARNFPQKVCHTAQILEELMDKNNINS